jgi:hypothetical protein
MRISGELINTADNNPDCVQKFINTCFLYDPQCKQQSSLWKSPLPLAAMKFWPDSPKGKEMSEIFFDWQGIVFTLSLLLRVLQSTWRDTKCCLSTYGRHFPQSDQKCGQPQSGYSCMTMPRHIGQCLCSSKSSNHQAWYCSSSPPTILSQSWTMQFMSFSRWRTTRRMQRDVNGFKICVAEGCTW